MAHTKAKGSSKLGRDSQAKRLGVKVVGGQRIAAGQIIIRQRGSKFFAGEGVKMAGDDSIYSLKEGKVKFEKKKIRRFSGRINDKVVVKVA